MTTGQERNSAITLSGWRNRKDDTNLPDQSKRSAKSARGSDDALALDFADLYTGQIHWSSGMGWQCHQGTHYAPDNDLQRYGMARFIARQAAGKASKKSEAKSLASARTVASILTLAQSDPKIVVPQQAWDADPFALNTPGGVVNLLTGELRPHQRDLVTRITRVAPDFKANKDIWDDFLQQVFGEAEKIDFMQRVVGYTMTADRREQKLFFMHGMGANGKSTFWDAIQWIVGTYALKLPASTLMRTSSDRHPTELAQLRGVRLSISSEPDEGQHWNEARIKELTGDETLTARFMRQDFFEFNQTQKHVLVGNYRPRLQGGDAAMARRLVLVNFDATFSGTKRDKDLPIKLRAIAPAILSWMIEGAIKWSQDGLRIPNSVQAASSEYMGDNDDLALWMAECCVLDLPSARTKASVLYQSFRDWIQARGQHVLAQRTWGERMTAVKGITKIKDSAMVYVGVALTAAEIHRINTARQRGNS
jgi:putative DNA primase/helicase